MSETITVKSEGLTLDLIVWRKYRKPTPGLVEQILRENPNLAELCPILPLGTTFTLPGYTPSKANENPVYRLWD